ncbi:MAG: hypothetical protein ABI954_04570, partial [Pyrinomonadaceae bacterium]
ITLVGMILGSLIPIVGIGMMFCGIYYCLFQKANGQTVSIDGLFKGFNYLLPSLIATLVIIIPSIVLMFFMYGSIFALVFAMAGSRGRMNDAAFPILFGTMMIEGVVIGLVLGCLHALIMFTYPLIVERGLSGVDAFKLSARAVWKNLNGVIGLILCEFALGLVGYMLCAVGVYLTLPIMFAGVFIAYRKVFPPITGYGAPSNLPPPPPTFVNESQYR